MLWSSTAGAVQEERFKLLHLYRLTDNGEVFPVFRFLRVQSHAVPLDTGLGWQLPKLSSSVPNTPRDGHKEALSHGELYSQQPTIPTVKSKGVTIVVHSSRRTSTSWVFLAPSAFLSRQKAGLDPGATHKCKAGNWRVAASGKWLSHHP